MLAMLLLNMHSFAGIKLVAEAGKDGVVVAE